MDHDDVWRAIDEQRSELADQLGDLTTEDWQTASLCDAWRVRDVAAHLTLAQMGMMAAMRGFLRAHGSFDGMIRDTALRQARLPVTDYPRLIRDMVGSRRKAPGVTELEPLIDILVHRQDMMRPLGRAHPTPVVPAAAAATRVWTMGFPFRAQRRFAGLEFVADDISWSAGAGRRVEGPIGSILLLLTGRTAAVSELSGPGTSVLSTSPP